MKKTLAIILALAICLGMGITAFAANKYTVTFHPNGGKVEPVTMEVTVGEKLGELPIPKRAGYEFDGWTFNGYKVTKDTVYSGEGDRVYTARWKSMKGYTLTFNTQGGTCSEWGRYVDFDSGIGELPIPTKTGYKFAGWQDADGTIVIERTRFEKSTTIYAQWVKYDPAEDDECKHEFGENNICKICDVVLVNEEGKVQSEGTTQTTQKPAEEGNPNTGAESAVALAAAMAVVGAAALYLGKKK